MKKIHWLSKLSIAAVLLLIVSGCELFDPFSDYRDKYLGVWEFEYTWSRNAIPIGTIDDSLSFTGTIKYGPADNELILQYTETTVLTVTVEKNGEILNQCEPGSWHNFCGGGFEGEDILNYSVNSRSMSSSFSSSLTGRKVSKKIPEKAPDASTQPATGITLTSAIVHGIVNPNFLSTTVYFEYGTSSSYGNYILATQGSISGLKEVSESGSIAGLTPGTLYHFRVKAVNSLGTKYGEDMSFTTYTASESVADIEGNVYRTIPIGNQVWMAENLKTGLFNDGSEIALVTDNSSWQSGTAPGYSWYNNDVTNKERYGALYNWYAVNSAKLCPDGWHIPENKEWTALENYLGGPQIAGGSMKETGTTFWYSPNTGASNNSGFTALAAGYRLADGSFFSLAFDGRWWTSSTYTAINENSVWSFSLSTFSGNSSHQNNLAMNYGLSVRCLKGNPVIRPDTLPSLTTKQVSTIGLNSAACGGSLLDNGGTHITERGVCWSTSPSPTIADSRTTDGNGTGSFTSNVTGLSAGTIYYIRAFAINSTGTGYGQQVIFQTLNPPANDLPVTDIDGNIYTTVIISNQTWMAENLKTTRYSDGTPVTGYSYFNNNPAYATIYGALYTWPAAMKGSPASTREPSGVQGVCPTGWHMPSEAEWEIMETFLGGELVAGGKMKEAGLAHWASPNAGATNESGFTGLPGDPAGIRGEWWSTDEVPENNQSAYSRHLFNSQTSLNIYKLLKTGSLSVRCIKNH
jgi:uncharacterized protein (TIGR02145 family)